MAPMHCPRHYSTHTGPRNNGYPVGMPPVSTALQLCTKARTHLSPRHPRRTLPPTKSGVPEAALPAHGSGCNSRSHVAHSCWVVNFTHSETWVLELRSKVPPKEDAVHEITSARESVAVVVHLRAFGSRSKLGEPTTPPLLERHAHRASANSHSRHATAPSLAPALV